MKYKIVTRDWKGHYTRTDIQDIKGWCLFGAESEIETGGDCFAMVFSEKYVMPPEITPQEVWDINEQLNDKDEVNGYTYVDGEYNTIMKCETTKVK